MISNILVQMRARIRKYGWCRNTNQNAKGEMCLMGALEDVAIFNFNAYRKTRGWLEPFLNVQFPGPPASVSFFNDHNIGSKQHALQILDKAIAQAQKEEGAAAKR